MTKIPEHLRREKAKDLDAYESDVRQFAKQGGSWKWCIGQLTKISIIRQKWGIHG